MAKESRTPRRLGKVSSGWVVALLRGMSRPAWAVNAEDPSDDQSGRLHSRYPSLGGPFLDAYQYRVLSDYSGATRERRETRLSLAHPLSMDVRS